MGEQIPKAEDLQEDKSEEETPVTGITVALMPDGTLPVDMFGTDQNIVHLFGLTKVLEKRIEAMMSVMPGAPTSKADISVASMGTVLGDMAQTFLTLQGTLESLTQGVREILERLEGKDIA